MDAESARAITGAIALTLFVLSLTVFVTALVTKGPDQEPNSLIGIKTRATKSSKQAWIAGHRVAYPYMMAGAAHCLASAVLIAGLLVLGFVPATAMLTLSVALALGAGVMLTMSGIKADREAKRHARVG
ncbi:SdpI family protein [Rhodococcus sp. IEGM 1330]|uniref:SdpI family protein n=1 Tax=Rhodococcus sp. IEGM 1330 TaxID=3082225 RepID=UPI0029557E89|nr:SdpI family protein [Rhodococcus sp. IEGM 1330]MDV8025114.1 SdpI family protein [Rhodococcus sp. IEGM 1330]